jgi:hypothetical protein
VRRDGESRRTYICLFSLTFFLVFVKSATSVKSRTLLPNLEAFLLI